MPSICQAGTMVPFVSFHEVLFFVLPYSVSVSTVDVQLACL